MIKALNYLSMATLFAWTLSAVFGLMAAPVLATAMAAACGLLLAVPVRQNMLLRALNALLDPLAIVLPALALRSLLDRLGLETIGLPTAALIGFFATYVLFLAAATDKLPFDPYRLGYAPGPVAVIVLLICAIGALHGSLFLPILAVVAQVLWLMRWGSSNYFDHILHAVLLPVVAIELISRLIAG